MDSSQIGVGTKLCAANRADGRSVRHSARIKFCVLIGISTIRMRALALDLPLACLARRSWVVLTGRIVRR
jgi:hypothetical protein